MLVLQYLQPEERKVSTKLGAYSQTAPRGAGSGQVRGQEFPGPPQKAAGTQKVTDLLLHLNFPESNFQTPGTTLQTPAKASQTSSPAKLPVLQLQRLPLFLYLQETIISKPRHLWEQPLASCPALCNEPVFTPTREEETALANPLVYQALFPGLQQGDKLLLKKILQKTLGTRRQLRAAPAQCQARSFQRWLPPALLNLWGWALLSHALGCPPRGLRMAMAEQGGRKGWPSSALTLPAQPPASWRTSERTFVWAAKLNLPPSCQGIGKAVGGRRRRRAGVRSSGKEGGRRAGSQLLRHCLRRKLAAPRQALPGLRTPKQGPGRQASRVRRRVPGALGSRPGRGPRSVARRRSEVGRDGKGGKSLRQVEGSG